MINDLAKTTCLLGLTKIEIYILPLPWLIQVHLAIKMKRERELTSTYPPKH